MSRILRAFAAVLAFFLAAPSAEIAAYPAQQVDALKLNFTVLSDGHLEANNKERQNNYSEAFADMASADPKSRALVMVGDNTMNGQVTEEAMLYGLMRKYNTVETVLMAAGNHELSPSKYNTGNYETLQKRFIRYNNAFLENQIDTLYYSRVVDGYHFIVLGSDKDAGIQQYLSPEQLEWLDGELQSAAESGKPVFLFSHWPLNDVFSKVWKEGHVGEQSDELKELLTKYDNRIFFFTGHLHMGIYENGYGVKEDGNITYINVPSFGSENTDGEAEVQNTGLGLQVEVYENEVLVRVRNFVEHEWTRYEYRFAV